MAAILSHSSVKQLAYEAMDVGKRLLQLPSSTAEIINILAEVEQILFRVQQSPSRLVIKALDQIITALIAKELLIHPDVDVNIAVACCICDVLTIMTPYNHEQMKEFFQLVVVTFEKLTSTRGGCYMKMMKVLETLSSVQFMELMSECLQLDELIVRLFKQFISVADSNSSAVVSKMEKIMTMIMQESKDLHELAGFLTTSVKKDRQITSPLSCQLGEKVLNNCAARLNKPHRPDMRVRRCQNSQSEKKRGKSMLSSDEPPLPSKAVKELNGKRKRGDKKVQCVEHGGNLVGERIKVWWPADKKYYEGVVKSFDSGTKKHTVLYADGDVERLDLKRQQWELVRKVSPPSDSVNYAVSHDEDHYSRDKGTRDKGKKTRELDSDLEDGGEEYEFAFTPEENYSENTDKSRKQSGLKRRISHKKKSVQNNLGQKMKERRKIKRKGKTYLRSEDELVKTVFRTRSSPQNMSYAASHISNNPSLKSYVEKMGFEKILKLHIDMIPANLAWSILSCYDVGRRCLILNGQHVEITRDSVYEIFGFPIGDLEIDFVKKINYKNLGCGGSMETFWKQFRTKDEVDEEDNPKSKRCYSTQLKDFILSRTTPNDTFKLNFIILLVSTMICANKGGESNMKFLPAIEEHYDNIHMYDWCGLVLKSLDQNPPDLPHNCATNRYCGPLTFLTLVYIRWLFRRTKRNENVIEYCTTDLLRKVDDEHTKFKNFGNFFNDDGHFFCEKDIRVVEDMHVLLKKYKQVGEEESQDMDSESQENNAKQNEILESSKSKEVTSPVSEEFSKSFSYEETDVTVKEAAKNERLENENLERSKGKQVSVVSSEEALFSNVNEVEAGPTPREVSSPQSGMICVQGYKVMNVYAPILEAIFKKHGDIAATCVFTAAAIRTSLLEGVCDIVRRVETNDVTNIISSIDEIESQVYVAEAAKINVSWLRASLNTIHKRNEVGKKVTTLMELKSNTTLVKRASTLVKRAAETDMKERHAEFVAAHAKLVAAQNLFAEAERCEEALKIVEKKLNDDVLESMAEKDLWAQKPVI